jgi:type IV pilus assembly protein PilW
MYAPKASMNMSSVRARRQRGASIIELMVGIVVAMLVGLAAAGSAAMFTASQRQGIGTGGVSVNAATVLAAVKNDAMAAGLGFFSDARYLCNGLNLSVGATLHVDGADFSPVQVTQGAAFDQLDIVYGTRIEAGANVMLKTATDGTSAELMSYLPVTVGQAVLLSPPLPGDPCTVRTVSANTASTDETAQVLTFDAAGTHNAGLFTTPPNYPELGRVTLLGGLAWNRYRVQDGNLILERPLDGTSAVLLRNVVAFRVQYGAAANAAGSTTLETWEDADGDFAAVSDANIARVRALRIALVVRSPQPERPDKTTGDCVASAAKPSVHGAQVELAAVDWACYRYRSANAVAPLRNIVMGLK